MIDYALSASYGNDSVALIQWAYESGLSNVEVFYSDTGWAAPFWEQRLQKGEALALSYGFRTHRVPSIGMESLVRQKKGWPRDGMQFCTGELKILPLQKVLNELDPCHDTTVLIGVRRAESARRRTFPEHQEPCEKNGHREFWSPLIRHTDKERDALILRAGLEILPHRSQECYPCVNANRSDLLLISEDEERVKYISDLEEEMGYTSNGNLRTMFRPKSKMGAIGFREVMRWAKSKRGKYKSPIDLGGGGCASGMCEIGDQQLFDWSGGLSEEDDKIIV